MFHPPPRYKEVVETVLRFKDSKEKQIRRAVIVLLPRCGLSGRGLFLKPVGPMPLVLFHCILVLFYAVD